MPFIARIYIQRKLLIDHGQPTKIMWFQVNQLIIDDKIINEANGRFQLVSFWPDSSTYTC